MSVEIRLLGPVETWVDGRPLDLGYAQQRCVFAVLVADLKKVIPAGGLVGRVWGEDPPSSANAALYAHIARLRRVLEGVSGITLARRAGGYVAEADPETVDLHRFRQLVVAARAADHGRAASLFDQALDLWHGAPFADLTSPWLDGLRDSLEAERMSAVLDRNEAYLHTGRHGELIGALTELCAAHPLDERLAGQLMRALYRSGRQADALGRYHQIRQVLTDELGIEPQPELRTLFEQVLHNDRALTPVTPHRTRPQQVPAELPHNVSGFVGRESELARLRALVHPGGCAASQQVMSIVVIDGVAGAGKTALAVHFAHQIAREFPDGQLFLDLGGFGPRERPMTPSAALERLLESLGADSRHVPRYLSERSARYRSMLAGQRVLIVLDNAASAEQVRPLLPGEGDCLVVVTSRSALAGLVATEGAVRISLDVLSAGESVALLASAISARRVTLEPGAAVRLAGLCGHLPLALRIAAGRAATHPHHTLADLAAELQVEHQRLDLLAADKVTSVRAAFRWSYRTLPVAAARTFRILGLHPGTDIDAAAAAALTADPGVGARLDELATACLLQPSGKTRYRMHDLVKLYASERAQAEEDEVERAAAVDRLLAWYLHTADAADRMLIPGRRRVPLDAAPVPTQLSFGTYHEALGWCDAERPSLVAITRLAEETGAHKTAWQLPVALWGYFMVRKPWSQWEVTNRIALAAARHLGDAFGEAYVLGSLAFVCLDQHRYREAIQNMSAALTWCRSSGDKWGAGIALLVLAMAFRQLGDQAAAIRSCHEALAIWRRMGDDWGAAHTLNNLGAIYRDRRRHDEAIDCLQEALEILAKAGDQWGQARTLTSIGSCLGDLGRHEEAIECLTQALRIRREITDQRGQAETLDQLAVVLLQTEAPVKARHAWRAALAIFEQLGDPQAETVRTRLRALESAGQIRSFWRRSPASSRRLDLPHTPPV
jgi:DNA-binding SARP family transcriptional activator/tetratricopeptide (TPR) repeat protein